MAGKVNYRFVALLSAIMIICTLALVGVWYTFVRTDPAEAIARGDGAYERGMYAQAAALYGKALKVRTNDVSLILKYTEAVRPIEVSDVRSARQAIQRLQGAYAQALELDPDNALAIERLMDLTMRIGKDLGDFEAWNQMLKTTNTALAANPDFVLARKYRGIAQVNRMESLDVSDSDKQQALEDLQIAVSADPDDAELAYHLVRWHLIQARELARHGGVDSEDARFHRAKARQRSEELLAHNPDDPMRQLYHVRVLTALDDHERAMEMFAQLETHLLTDPNPADVVLAVADRLAFVSTRPLAGEPLPQGNDSGLDRTEQLLRAAIEAHPHDLRFQVALGRTLTFQGQYDEAMTVLQAVADATIQDTAIDVMRDSDLQQRAMTQHADLVLTLAKDMPESERERALEQVEDLVRRIQAGAGNAALVSLLEGKINIVRGDWATALEKLDRASALYNDQNPEALLFSATARIQLGETGAAVERLEKLAQLRPDYMPARYELLRQLLRLGRHEQLARHVDSILAVDPTNFEARRYAALALARQGQVPAAIELFEELDPAAHPSLAAPLSQLYLAADQPDRAAALLQRAFAQTPGDASVLLQLLNITTDRDQAATYLQQARQAGVGERLIALLEQKIDGRLDADRVAAVEQLIEAENDPFRREANRYRLYRGLGRDDDARHALDQMAQLRPDDVMVIEAQFNEALAQRDWEVAEQIADKARQDNLDLAQGLFYRGRLELARGDADTAVATLNRALDTRGVYSQGWMYLAEAQKQAGRLPAAGDSYRRAMQQNPSNVEAVRGLVGVLDAQRQYDEALGELRDVMVRNPQSAALLELYLTYEQDHGSRERALQIRQRLVEVNPDDTNNRRATAVLLAQMKRHDQARRMVEQLIAEEGQTRQNVFAAASVRGMSGDVDGARQLMQQYVDTLGAGATMDDWLAVARFMMRANDVEGSIAAYQQAMRREDAVAAPATRELADTLFAMGRNADAAELYRKLYDRDRQDQRVAYRYVESLVRSENFDLARTTLDDILARNPRTASAYLLAALIARQQDDHQRALQALDNAADIEPNRAMIYYERAQVRRQINNMDPKIRSDLQHAVELDPQFAAARRQLTEWYINHDDRSKAIGELITLLQQHPRDISTRVQLAELFYTDRQYLQLHALLKESAQLFPDSAVWPQMQARLYAQDNQRDKAAEAFEQSFRLEPTAERLTELCSQWLELGRTGETLALMREYDQLAGDTAVLAAMRARALGAEGFDDQARAMFAHAMEGSTSVAEAFTVATHLFKTLGTNASMSLLDAVHGERTRPWAQMAIARAMIDAGAYQQAVDRLRRIESQVTSLSDDRLAYYRLLSTAQYAMNDYQDAVEAYERILELDADNLFALNNLAYLLAEDLQRVDDAMSLAQRAVIIAPHNAQVQDTLGWVQFHAGMQEAAIQSLKQSVHLRSFGTNCYHLAVVFQAAGEYRQAEEMFTMARQLAEQEQNTQLIERIEQGISR